VGGREAAGVCVRENKIPLCVLFCDDVISSNFLASNVNHERTLGEELVQMLHCRNRSTSLTSLGANEENYWQFYFFGGRIPFCAFSVMQAVPVIFRL